MPYLCTALGLNWSLEFLAAALHLRENSILDFKVVVS